MPGRALRSAGLVLAIASLGGAAGCSVEVRSVQGATPSPTTNPGADTIGDCAPGTAYLGTDRTCAPVGTTSIPEGFVAAPDGWGFVPIVPAEACQGDTRASLGSTACVPIDDCAAAFPPSNATVVVSTKGGTWSVPTVATIAEAVATGAKVIAIDSGTYAGGIAPTRSVSFVGRCTKETIIAASSGNDEHGIAAAAAGAEVSVSSLTFQKFLRTGAGAVRGGTIKLARVRMIDNAVGVAAQAGSSATIEESVIESTVRVTDPKKPMQGLEAQSGGTVEVATSELRGLSVMFANQGKGSNVTIKRSVLERHEVASAGHLFVALIDDASARISESVLRGREHELSVGRLGGADRAKLEVSSTAVIDLAPVGGKLTDAKSGAFRVNPGASLSLDNVTIRGAERRAVYADGNGSATLTSVVVAGIPGETRGPMGVYALGGAKASLDHVAILRANGTGLVVAGAGSSLTMKSSLVHGTSAADGVAFGIGAVDDGVLVAEDCTISKNADNGVVVTAAKAELTRALVWKNHGDDPSKGVGIGAARDGFISVRDSEIVGNNVAAFFFIGASGLIANSRATEHAIGLLKSGVASRSAPTIDPPPGAREVILVDTALGGNQEAESEATHVQPLPEPAY